MLLAAYLKQTSQTPAEFARTSGVGSRAVIFNYLTDRRFPTPDNLILIRNATDGAVTANDFVAQFEASRRYRRPVS